MAFGKLATSKTIQLQKNSVKNEMFRHNILFRRFLCLACIPGMANIGLKSFDKM